MAGKIDFIPGGKSITAHGHDSVLQAGLKGGMSLNYRCSNGNCGECRGVLRSGKLERLRNHDFILSDSQKGQGHFLMCSNAPDGDIVVQAHEVDDIVQIPEQFLTGKVKTVEQVDSQVMLLHLRTPRSQRLQFMAGQSVELGGNNGLPTGRFPVASCPCDETSLLFHIPDMPGDAFSQAVFSDALSKGSKLDVRGPFGEFRLNEKREKSVIFIAWHTGFAPVKSIIESVISLRTAEDIHLFRVSPVSQGSSQAERHYLDNYCRSWDDALHNFTYHPVTQRFSLVSAVDVARDIAQDILSGFGNLADYDFYIVGPPAFRAGMEDIINGYSLEDSRIRGCDVCMGLL